MSKAKIFIEIEIDINKDNPNDKGLAMAEIAEFACGGVVYSIKGALVKNTRTCKLTKASYEYTIKKSCLD